MDKLKKYQTEAAKLKDRLASPVPKKHAAHPETFKAFLRNELRLVNIKLESLKA